VVTYYRRLPRFDYVKAVSFDDVLKLLGNGGGKTCKVYAGGTDLIPKLKERVIRVPDFLIDLKGIPDLDYIEYGEEGVLKIGALTTVYQVAQGTGTYQTGGQLAGKGIQRFDIRAPEQHQCQNGQKAYARNHGEKDGPVLEHTEGRSGVVKIAQAEKTFSRPRFPEHQIGTYPEFAELVQGDHNGKDRQIGP